MVTLVHAKKAQNLASDQDYRHPLPQHTSLAEDLRLSCAKKAHKLQSEVKSPGPLPRGLSSISYHKAGTLKFLLAL